LIARTKELYDNATPSANAMAAMAVLRLASLTGRDDLAETGRLALESVRIILERAPSAAGQSLIALDFLLAPTKEFAIVARPDDGEMRAVLETLASRFLPHKVVAPARVGAGASESLVPLLADRPVKDERATVYVCENRTCQAPVVGVAGLMAALGPS
jgi:uncharacterized protein YyaL (SSP411 family)